jgi:hypothetical protein
LSVNRPGAADVIVEMALRRNRHSSRFSHLQAPLARSTILLGFPF